jgi:hypothetical protein
MPYIGNPIYQSAFVTDQFTGNGSTTAFTMSVAPAGTSNVLVAVSGVLQDQSTYGVSGNTLTFTTAPPPGTGNISCRYLGVPVTGVTTTAYRTVTEFTATSGQTTFTPPSYTAGYINVYLNGVRLGSSDYTASNGTTVVLATGAASGNLVTVESFLVSSVLNAIPNTPASVGTSNIQSSVTLTTPTIDKINTSVTNTSLGAGNASIMKNRIINGAMVISQRGTGSTTVASSGYYSCDMWNVSISQASKVSIQQNAGSVTPPVGFKNYVGITTVSAYTPSAGDYGTLRTFVEGYNVADLAWGTANAKTVTLSFQVYSSLTGTFGGVLQNNAGNRSYPFTYTIASANTWTPISITIAGDTSGTWATDNSRGIEVDFNIASGSTYQATAGAWAAGGYYSATGATNMVATASSTFYLTAVQLEVGSSATGYEYRQYTQELVLCQRYFNKYSLTSGSGPSGFNDSSTKALAFYNYPVTMRTTPTLGTTGTASDYLIRYTGNTANLNAVPSLESATDQQIRLACTVASGLTAGQGIALIGTGSTIYLSYSAEL